MSSLNNFSPLRISSESIKNGSPVYDEKNSAEYLKQLKAQEHGINKMMAVDWLKNKFTFDEFGRQKDNNATVRTRIKRDLSDGFNENYAPRLEAKNYSDQKISRMEKKYVAHVMKDTAALHNSDQVSGGKTQIEYEKGSIKNRTDLQNSDIIGGSRANWYIGTQQWPRKEDHEARATELKQHVVTHYNNTPESDKNKLMMNVTLKVV